MPQRQHGHRCGSASDRLGRQPSPDQVPDRFMRHLEHLHQEIWAIGSSQPRLSILQLPLCQRRSVVTGGVVSVMYFISTVCTLTG
jgi:hypothetical protein